MVRPFDKIVLLRYRAELEMPSQAGGTSSFVCWHTDSDELHDRLWQVVFSQATRVASRYFGHNLRGSIDRRRGGRGQAETLPARRFSRDHKRIYQDASVTYQIIYSSRSTMPMQADDLEELLANARSRNEAQGISGALVYADRLFLQILEGEHATVQALMATIRRDGRHEAVTILREGEVASAKFSQWKMAYVSATPEQAARWAGISVAPETEEAISDAGEDRRTAQFAQDILALLTP